MMKLLIVGAGAMSEALVQGWVASGLARKDITMTNRSGGARLTEVAARHGVQTVEQEDVSLYDVVMLGMQPDGVLDYVANQQWTNQTIVSIAAHITPYEIEQLAKRPTVAAMPNTPVAHRLGMTGLWFGSRVNEEIRSVVEALFGRVGEIAEANESTMPAFMAAAGCSPAFFYEIVAGMVPVLTDAGFKEENARRIVAQAMKGSAEILMRSDASTDRLIADVAAPGGPTDRGVQVLREHHLFDTIQAALRESARETDE